jgi:hypothetical protein
MPFIPRHARRHRPRARSDPPALKTAVLGTVPSALSEMEVARLLTERALRDGTTNNRYENEDSPSFM